MLLGGMRLVVQHATACGHGIGYNMLLIKSTQIVFGVNEGTCITLQIFIFQL